MNFNGSVSSVRKAELKQLIPTHELMVYSLNKVFTRHFTNLSLYMPQSEYTFFTWLIYMSSPINTLKYTTMLLEQYKEASNRAVDIYKPEKVTYNIDPSRTREYFIKLVEGGYLIKLSNKEYMINPILVYHKMFIGKDIQKGYQSAVKSENVSEELTKYCESLIKRYESTLPRSKKK